MKKTAIALAVSLTGFATLAKAVPNDDSWYVGGKLGWSQYHKINSDEKGSANHANNDSALNKKLGTGIFIGYNKNQQVGFELGYDWLGRVSYKNKNNNNTPFKAQGLSLSTKLSYPLTEEMDIYTRIGGMLWHTDSKSNNIKNNENHEHNHYTSISPLAAIGLEYAWNKNWVTRLDYQWINKIGSHHTTNNSLDNSMLMMGVSYRFDQNHYHFEDDQIDSVAPAPVQTSISTSTTTPNPHSVNQIKPFVLKSEIFFNFDKSTLKAEGRQVLDQLYSKLNSMNAKEYSIVVLGYTDYIGDDSYNKKLSESRAQNVINYLISKGIPSYKISGRGMGRSNPVTENNCKSIKDRSSMIACLSHDRRVDIEIRGITSTVTQPRLGS